MPVEQLNTNYANKRQLSDGKNQTPEFEEKITKAGGSSVSHSSVQNSSTNVFHRPEHYFVFRISVSVFLCGSKLAFIGVIGVQNPTVRIGGFPSPDP
jgi:hypothetical protein